MGRKVGNRELSHHLPRKAPTKASLPISLDKSRCYSGYSSLAPACPASPSLAQVRAPRAAPGKRPVSWHEGRLPIYPRWRTLPSGGWGSGLGHQWWGRKPLDGSSDAFSPILSGQTGTIRIHTERTQAVRNPRSKTQRCSPANKIGLNEPHGVVPSHTAQVALCNPQNPSEAMLCHL